MYCPRLEHFTRLNQNGTVGKCGHMTGGKGFDSFEELEQSKWLQDLKDKMANDQWPDECVRCQRSEAAKGESMRTNSIDRHRILKPLRGDYLIVGGVLDNVCNSACQSCNAGLSTKIGSLESKNYPRVDNLETFNRLPLDRMIELDVNGGEPTASKNYRQVLGRLPNTVRIVRMNTNGSRMIGEMEQLLEKGVKVIVTLSLDGIGRVHDYARWPIKWNNFKDTVDTYLRMRDKYKLLQLDFWTTVSALNIGNLHEIIKFAGEKKIPHDWAFLTEPSALSVRYKNRFTVPFKHLYPEQIAVDENNEEHLQRFLNRQDRLRNISFEDYLSF